MFVDTLTFCDTLFSVLLKYGIYERVFFRPSFRDIDFFLTINYLVKYYERLFIYLLLYVYIYISLFGTNACFILFFFRCNLFTSSSSLSTNEPIQMIESTYITIGSSSMPHCFVRTISALQCTLCWSPSRSSR